MCPYFSAVSEDRCFFLLITEYTYVVGTFATSLLSQSTNALNSAIHIPRQLYIIHQSMHYALRCTFLYNQDFFPVVTKTYFCTRQLCRFLAAVRSLDQSEIFRCFTYISEILSLKIRPLALKKRILCFLRWAYFY
jgi:hypothetical protein